MKARAARLISCGMAPKAARTRACRARGVGGFVGQIVFRLVLLALLILVVSVTLPNALERAPNVLERALRQ